MTTSRTNKIDFLECCRVTSVSWLVNTIKITLFAVFSLLPVENNKIKKKLRTEKKSNWNGRTNLFMKMDLNKYDCCCLAGKECMEFYSLFASFSLIKFWHDALKWARLKTGEGWIKLDFNISNWIFFTLCLISFYWRDGMSLSANIAQHKL
jgi:hypothetical protein